MSWSLVAAVLPLMYVEKGMKRLYFQLLPFLGVNCCITDKWYMLPERFQYLGLFKFDVIIFVKNVF